MYSNQYHKDNYYMEDNKTMERPDYDKNNGMPKKVELAHAYVPFQQMNNILDPEECLCNGTVFPELVMPYKKRG